jgi:ADP-ribose pyrophosphatase
MTSPPTLTLQETLVESQTLFHGRVLRLTRDTVALHTGDQATREVVHHPGGVVVLPVLSDGRVVFIRQFRYALGHVLLELPAGKLEPGEPPFEAIQRELQEETGYVAQQWQPMGHIYTAPGFCNERLWLFQASQLVHQPMAGYDAAAHGEYLEPALMTRQEIAEAAENGLLTDAKTICLLAMAGYLGPR